MTATTLCKSCDKCRREHSSNIAINEPTEQRKVKQSLPFGVCSDIGNHRSRNEDSCFADGNRGVFLVVDGVGGYQGGKEASEMVADIIPAWLNATRGCRRRDGQIIKAAVMSAIETIQYRLTTLAKDRPSLDKASATAVLALIDGDRLYVARVGDCRAYLLHDGELQRLSIDQSFVGAALEAGAITEAQAANHPWRHLVTNSISAKPLNEPIELQEFSFQPGDRLMLSSDGVHDFMSTEEISQRLAASDPEIAATAIVARAMQNGSRDNASCVVVEQNATDSK